MWLIKRFFDIILSFLGLSVFFWLIFIIWLIATVETRTNGFFFQMRVGKGGKLFKLIKIKTMKPVVGINSTNTSSKDVRITRSGRLFRNTKLDELPTLWNVLKGDMSLVGPRPDVQGYADELRGKDRRILELRPGITGLATLEFVNEEQLLSTVEDLEKFNDEVIFPKKIKLNLEYLDNWSLWLDIKIIFKTIFRMIY
jgi:lipopolysaccharide/colanic/teichoic acid biosynthesis glycosyltransferase